MLVRNRQLGCPDDGQWSQYTEVVTQRRGRGRYTIWLRPNGVRRGSEPRSLGQYRRTGLGAINQTEGSLLSTGAAVGTSVGLASTIGLAAGPVGAAAGAIVAVIAGLFEASAARAKGATEENQAVNEYLPAWDQGLQAIFAAANNGTATASECISALGTLMQSWWAAAAQFKSLPGVADASGGGANCGSYTPGVSTPCTPTGGPGCDKSCTAMCCIGCHDLMPSAAYAAYVLGLPQGGTVNVCTVYGSGYGASQRDGYSLTYTPPPPSSAAGVATGATTAITSALGISDSTMDTPLILGALALGLLWWLA